jgi:hypothetical protein
MSPVLLQGLSLEFLAQGSKDDGKLGVLAEVLRSHVEDLVSEANLRLIDVLFAEEDWTQPLGRAERNGGKADPPMGSQRSSGRRFHVRDLVAHHAPHGRGQELLRALDGVGPRDPDVAEGSAGQYL